MAQKHRIALYLAGFDVGGDLPPERFYTTLPGQGAELIGYVESDYPLERTIEGADYHHPDIDARGRYSARSLVMCAFDNSYGLSWIESIARAKGRADTTKDD